MELGINGKRGLVLGSSAGIGKAIASELVREGVQVVLCSRSEERLRAACRDTGAGAYIVADLSRPGEGTRAVREATRLTGCALDILVTNTGGPPKGGFLDVGPAEWTKAFSGLWASAAECISEALPGMRSRKWGRVVLVTSVAAAKPLPAMTISNGLRAGLLGLTRSLAQEFACDGITFNSILPGYTDTERLRELGIDLAALANRIPARRLADPQEIGKLAAFLCSQAAAYINGQSVACDGGFLYA